MCGEFTRNHRPRWSGRSIRNKYRMQCATHCVLYPSAVAVHAYALCGYCDYCTGYFEANLIQQNEGAENKICPTDAVVRY